MLLSFIIKKKELQKPSTFSKIFAFKWITVILQYLVNGSTFDNSDFMFGFSGIFYIGLTKYILSGLCWKYVLRISSEFVSYLIYNFVLSRTIFMIFFAFYIGKKPWNLFKIWIGQSWLINMILRFQQSKKTEKS